MTCLNRPVLLAVLRLPESEYEKRHQVLTVKAHFGRYTVPLKRRFV